MKTKDLLLRMSQITSFALPISAGGLVYALNNFLAMMMVAQLGKNSLAAASLAVSTFMSMTIITTTIFYSVGILISHSRGQENLDLEIGKITKNGFWLAFIVAIPSAILLWNADKLLLIFKQDPSLVKLTVGYFHFAAINILPLLCGSVINQFFSGIGMPRLSFVVALINLPLSLIAAYAFILGKFGLPSLGLSGLACASLLAQTIVLIFVLIFLRINNNMDRYKLFENAFTLDFVKCKLILALGFPIGVQFGGEFVALTVSVYLLGFFGTTVLAASQVVSQYYMLIIIPVIGLTQALSLLTSEALGKGDNKLIKEYLLTAIIILIFLSLAISILFFLFPENLIHLYIDNKILDVKLKYFAIAFFSINAFLLFFDGLRHLLSGALRGLHDSQAPMRIGIACLWGVSLPICCFFGFIFPGGPIALRVGFLSGFIIAAVLLILRIREKFHLN